MPSRTAEQVVESYVASQGWTPATVADLLTRFIDDRYPATGAERLDAFLCEVAGEENSLSVDD